MGYTASYDTSTHKAVPKDAVVLDFDGYTSEMVAEVVAHLRKGYWWTPAEQIEQQTKPPRIPEPGLWGVVEASCVHSEQRRRWVRKDKSNWQPIETNGLAEPDDWDSLIDPRLIREGVA